VVCVKRVFLKKIIWIITAKQCTKILNNFNVKNAIKSFNINNIWINTKLFVVYAKTVIPNFSQSRILKTILVKDPLKLLKSKKTEVCSTEHACIPPVSCPGNIEISNHSDITENLSNSTNLSNSNWKKDIQDRAT